MRGPRITIEVHGSDVRAVAPQLPRAESLAPGTRVVAFAGKSRRWLGKLLPPRDAPPLAAIGSALLARGYGNIGAGIDDGRAAAWGDSGDGMHVAPIPSPAEPPDAASPSSPARATKGESAVWGTPALLNLLQSEKQLVRTLDEAGLRVADDVRARRTFPADVADEATDLCLEL